MKEKTYETRIQVLGGIFLLAAFLLVGLASVTHAQAVTTSTTSTTVDQNAAPVIAAPPSAAPASMELTVDGNGGALLRGIVQQVQPGLITVAGWGGTWTVRTAVQTQVTPIGINGNGDVSSIAPGDFIGAEGVIAPDQVWTINASFVRDWTKTPDTTVSTPVATDTTDTTTDTSASSSSVTTPVTTPDETSSSSMPVGETLYTGTATGVGSSTFTLTDPSGATYTVNATPDATLWDTNGNTISPTDLQENDNVRLDGVLSGTTITADVIRDTSR